MKSEKNIPFRRKREGRTNYKKRLLLLKSRLPRLIIRKTNRQIILQIAEYSQNGDRILCGVGSLSLKKEGWLYSCKNLPACYLAGMVLGKKALAKKIKKAILDLGLQTTLGGTKVYAALKGAIDAGMEIPASEEIWPKQDRLTGEHIAKFFSFPKDAAQPGAGTQFAEYKRNKIDANKLKNDFENLKKKILSG